MIEIVGTIGIVIMTVIEVEIDVDLIRMEVDDHIHKEVTGAVGTLVLIGGVEEIVHEAVTDEA